MIRSLLINYHKSSSTQAFVIFKHNSVSTEVVGFLYKKTFSTSA